MGGGGAGEEARMREDITEPFQSSPVITGFPIDSSYRITS